MMSAAVPTGWWGDWTRPKSRQAYPLPVLCFSFFSVQFISDRMCSASSVNTQPYICFYYKQMWGCSDFPYDAESCWSVCSVQLIRRVLFLFLHTALKYDSTPLTPYTFLYLIPPQSPTSSACLRSRPPFMGETWCRLIDTKYCFGCSAKTNKS